MCSPFTRRAQDFFDPRPTEPDDGPSVPGWVEEIWNAVSRASLADYLAAGVDVDAEYDDAAALLCARLGIDLDGMTRSQRKETESRAYSRMCRLVRGEA